MASGPKRTVGQTHKDNLFVSRLYLKGYSYRQIAVLFKEDKRGYTISHAQIGFDMKKMLQEWKEEQDANIDSWVASELQKVAYLEQQYHASWEKSIRNQKKTKKKTGYNSFGRIDETTKEDIESCGDPRFLQGIERCIQKRCDLLGLDKAKVIEVKTALDVTVFEYEQHPGLKKVG